MSNNTSGVMKPFAHGCGSETNKRLRYGRDPTARSNGVVSGFEEVARKSSRQPLGVTK
jgi:hypothetical protein